MRKATTRKSRLTHNFGMARPEGYRKAVRLMEMADRFGLPVITLVDTPGAYPGKGAEERGQSEAIARATETCLQIGVPLVSVIIGEGGSGGAVAFATANRVAMLEHSIYSVISPEGCASILWKDSEKMREAAEALRLTAQDLLRLGVATASSTSPSAARIATGRARSRRSGRTLAAMLAELSAKDRRGARPRPARQVSTARGKGAGCLSGLSYRAPGPGVRQHRRRGAEDLEDHGRADGQAQDQVAMFREVLNRDQRHAHGHPCLRQERRPEPRPLRPRGAAERAAEPATGESAAMRSAT